MVEINITFNPSQEIYDLIVEEFQTLDKLKKYLKKQIKREILELKREKVINERLAEEVREIKEW